MAERVSELTTPIPFGNGEGLQFAQLTGFDAISSCFKFEVVAISENYEISATSLLGKECTVSAKTNVLDADQTRYFSGVVDQFCFLGHSAGSEGDAVSYRLVLRPRLWLLSRMRDNRIFQQMSVPEIICEILDENGFTNYEVRLNDTYAPRVYCVQYAESTLDFVQRLMEHEGIFYFHEFSEGEHKLILADQLETLKPQPELQTLRYEPDTTDAFRGAGVITSWSMRATIVTGIHTQTDYDFRKPSADLMTRSGLPMAHPESEAERYDYPGVYSSLAEGQRLTDLRLDESQSTYIELELDSTASLPWSGNTFELSEHPRQQENGTYFIRRVDYMLRDDQYVAAETVDPDAGWSARCQVSHTSSRWRPPHVTPRPVMRGPQTAMVVGPSGEEIYTDQYSRVKVQFHWDRHGDRDENASCWVRVSSAWAGSGWGFIQIPRIGQEVIVDFLEGDPDQPIITGRVYNAAQMPPYGLPGSATKSGWKSNSSKGGGGWNELMFEDKKGDELVYFQAEKDHDELVKNNETRHIGNDWSEEVVHDATQWVGNDRRETVDNCKWTHVKVDRSVNIDNNDTEVVGNNRTLTVGVDEAISVGSNSTEKIGANHKQTVGSNQTIDVGLNQTETIGGNRMDTVKVGEVRNVGAEQLNTIGAARQVAVGADQSHTIGAADSWNVGASQSVSVGQDQSVSIGKAHSLGVGTDSSVNVAKNLNFSIGDNTVLDTGKNLTLTAGDSITLNCGDATIQMKKDGTITISGKDITLKGSGKINVKAGGEVVLKGSKILQN